MKQVLILLSMFFCMQAFALNPSKTYAAKPSDFGLTYEEVTITTSDNVNLKGWLYRPAEVSYKMIILSDDGDGNMADLIEIASNFVSLGYNVLTYDYRGYGESDNFEIKNSFYIYSQFSIDLNSVIDYVKKYHAKNRNLQLYGQGIGAGLSLANGATRCGEITRIIADSPFSTLEDVKNAIKIASGQDVLMPLGYDKYRMEPQFALEAKGASLAGIMIIYGKDDPVYNEKMIKKISKLRSSITTVMEIKGATKETTFSSDKNRYFKAIKEFI